MNKLDNVGNVNIRRPNDVREPAGPVPNYKPIILGLNAFVADAAKALGIDVTQDRAPSHLTGPGKPTVFSLHDKAVRSRGTSGTSHCGGSKECERRRRRMAQ